MEAQKALRAIVLLLFLSGQVLANVIHGNERSEITIYVGNIAAVSETRLLKLKPGRNTLTISGLPSQLQPGSVHFDFSSSDKRIEVLEHSFKPEPWKKDRLLLEFVDQPISLVTEGGEVVSGLLVGMLGNEPILRLSSGEVVMVSGSRIVRILLPDLPERFQSGPALVLTVESNAQATVPCEISYVCSGLSWEAQYVGILNRDENELTLDAWASIVNNSGANFEGARLTLVAGEIHRATRARPQPLRRTAEMNVAAVSPAPVEKPFFEFHSYRFDRAVNLSDGQTKQVPLFPPAHLRCNKVFVFDGQTDGRRVRVQIEALNSKEMGLGRPLPEGIVRLFKRNDASLQLLGEDRIENVPEGGKIRLLVGYAFDLEGERTLMESKRLGKSSREETYTIVLKNHKDEQVGVRVVEHLWGDWEMKRASHTFEKSSATQIEFPVKVPPKGETTIEYTVLLRY